jgi:hypothetical protein
MIGGNQSVSISCKVVKVTLDQIPTRSLSPLEQARLLESAGDYTDTYRYWHAIHFLLSETSPYSSISNWISAEMAELSGAIEIPASRFLYPAEVAGLADALKKLEPEDLVERYNARAMDEAGIYPMCWQEWEESFDPLGQVLEYYSYFREFVLRCASTGDALLFQYYVYDDGNDE